MKMVYTAMFAPKQVGGQDLGQFVTKPFKFWGKILQKASAHGTKSYHLSSMTMSSWLDMRALLKQTAILLPDVYDCFHDKVLHISNYMILHVMVQMLEAW